VEQLFTICCLYIIFDFSLACQADVQLSRHLEQRLTGTDEKFLWLLKSGKDKRQAFSVAAFFLTAYIGRAAASG
jgi:hypothetical protein